MEITRNINKADVTVPVVEQRLRVAPSMVLYRARLIGGADLAFRPRQGYSSR